MSNIKYKLIKRQSSSNCGLTWNDLLPTVYLVGSIVENPSNCTSEESVRYRYVQVPMSEAFDCDTETFTKYQIAKKQYSYDGNVWFDVSPLEFVRSGDTEEFSVDCGADVAIYEWFNLDPNEDWYCVCDEADETNYYETFDNLVHLTYLNGVTGFYPHYTSAGSFFKNLNTLEMKYTVTAGGEWSDWPEVYSHFILNTEENVMLKFKANDSLSYVSINGEFLDFDSNREINITINETSEIIFGIKNGQNIYDGIHPNGIKNTWYRAGTSRIELTFEGKYIVFDDACGTDGYLVTRHVNSECESEITKIEPFLNHRNICTVIYNKETFREISGDTIRYDYYYYDGYNKSSPIREMGFAYESLYYGVEHLGDYYILPEESCYGKVGSYELPTTTFRIGWGFNFREEKAEKVIIPCMKNFYYLGGTYEMFPPAKYIDFSSWDVSKVRQFNGIVNLNRYDVVNISGWKLGDKRVIGDSIFVRTDYQNRKTVIINDVDIEFFRLVNTAVGVGVENFITNIPVGNTKLLVEADNSFYIMVNSNDKRDMIKVEETDREYTFDLENANTNVLLTTSGLFKDNTKLTRVIEFPTTNYVDSMSKMFSGCTNLISIDCLNEFDTSNVTDMNGMFSRCSSLETIDLSSFDTSNVTDMKFMFQEAVFTELDLSAFDVSNVEDMSYMFNICSNLEKLNLSNWDLKSDVLTENMFNLCKKLSCIVMANCSQETKDIIQAALDAVELISVCIVDNEDDCPSAEDNLTIKYTTTDNQKLTTLDKDIPIASHTFENGVGKILLENGDALRYRNFDYQHTLKTISLPDGINAIGGSFFHGCENLEEATWSENFQFLPSFNMCSSLKSVNIPSGVTSIGNNAFNGCTSLTSINIPSGVTSIGGSAFSSCSGITSVTFEEVSQLTTIGDSAFNGCTSLTSIIIPSGVTSIGNNAFNVCSGITSVTFEEDSQVTAIGEYAFNGCTNLTTINIPSGVKSISYRAFQNCRKLANIEYNGTKAQFTNITKYSYWKLNVPNTCIVHCTDGDFPISDFK